MAELDFHIEKLLSTAQKRLVAEKEDLQLSCQYEPAYIVSNFTKNSPVSEQIFRESSCRSQNEQYENGPNVKYIDKQTTSTTKGKRGCRFDPNSWHRMPRTRVTAETKRDFELLRMREILDPKRHYKKESSKALPKYSQHGTIVDSRPSDLRLGESRKNKGRNLVVAAMEYEIFSGSLSRRYADLQDSRIPRHKYSRGIMRKYK